MELINVYYNNCSILYIILTILSVAALCVSIIVAIIAFGKDKLVDFVISFFCFLILLCMSISMGVYYKNSITKIYTIDDSSKVEPYIESIEDKLISYNYKDNVLTVIEENKNE